MIKYPKIQTLFRRDDNGNIIEGEITLDEFKYLKDNIWIWTEKVDGTNIRIGWDGEKVKIRGRTDNAQIPAFLYDRLQELFPVEKFKGYYPEMVLFGEGYGRKIQKGGSNYKPDGVDFVLFDAYVNGWWLTFESIQNLGASLGINVVPIVGKGTLSEAIEFVRNGFNSRWGDFLAEGLVIRPEVMMLFRNGNPIMTKLKYKDFRRT